jgi:hypothetical protein
MVIAEKLPEKNTREAAVKSKVPARHASAEPSENPISAIKNFVCKYV